MELVRLIPSGNAGKIAKCALDVSELMPYIYEAHHKKITEELKGLSSKTTPSILRNTDKDSLNDFSWEKIAKELAERTPTFWSFLLAACHNPSQERNKMKTGEYLLPAIVSAACKVT